MRFRYICLLHIASAVAILLVVVSFYAQEFPCRWGSYTGVVSREVPISDGLGGPSPGLHPLGLRDTSSVAPTKASTQVKVIIVTYMRSGSSFTGDLFNHHRQAFYVYEPLWRLQKLVANRYPIVFFNKSTTQMQPDRWIIPSSLAEANVRAFLGCEFQHLDLLTLSQNHLTQSQTTLRYYECQRERPGVLGILQCLPLLYEACRQADVTAVKTIRFSMAQASRLLKTDPKVKVIHLVRDPRATLRSQRSVGQFTTHSFNETSGAIRRFCQRIIMDLQQAAAMKTQFPGRLLSIRYEDLAMEPLRFAEKVLAFAGLTMDETFRHYLWNITSAGLPNSCAICTTRTSSKATAMAWRTKLSFFLSRMVDRKCGQVYHKMGYLPLSKREMLTDLKVPSFVDSAKVPGLWAV